MINIKKPIKMIKTFYFDLETTGVRYWRNGIHQIAGLIDIDGEIVDKFDFKVKPHPKAVIEQEALDVSGKTVEEVQNYPPMDVVFNELIQLMDKHIDRYDKKDKFVMAGYNCAGFDSQFLRAFFVQNGDKYFGSWFWSVQVDVMIIAMDALKHERQDMINFKLATVCGHVGVPFNEEEAHDALYDVIKTRELYHAINKINNNE